MPLRTLQSAATRCAAQLLGCRLAVLAVLPARLPAHSILLGNVVMGLTLHHNHTAPHLLALTEMETISKHGAASQRMRAEMTQRRQH